ncbi:hypothetical protein COCHEDRAFT_1092434 [Bipolaris maydis C5]|uniref:Zn(2)-C6 fungal-type domain-containing protein n=2 Tax=Cochliobolus heterostrophus (strain C5 / ATCC 48332 / race O) TaxID=701091 RepID=M2TBU1_COCH5|nr:hypothetical protein COCHEDRAFT_1092073 [Bipolaris maydis C5]EMD95290.1 hypothetical protein COCHEDRAFT_1092434 [Bipolaris maydis C5]
MPKVPSSSRQAPAITSTQRRQARSDKIRCRGKEMTFRCKRCEKKNLRCFVDTASGQCAGCIAVKAECSLFVTEEEWEKVEAEKRQKRLELARSEEQTARLRRELLEVEERERAYADRDHALLSLQNREKEEAEGTSAPGMGFPTTEPSLPAQSTDPGWLQADYSSSYDPFLSLDYYLPFENPVLASSNVSGENHVLVPNFFDLVFVVFELYVRC